MSRGNKQGWHRNWGQRQCCWGLWFTGKLPPSWLWDCEGRNALPGVLVELLIHPTSISESQEAVNMDQKDQKPAISSGLGRGRLVKGGNWSGRAVVPQGWHRGHALQGDVHLQQQHRGSWGEVVQLILLYWRSDSKAGALRGVRAIFGSSCNSQSSQRGAAAVEEGAGIGVCHPGWYHSSDKGVGQFFSHGSMFSAENSLCVYMQCHTFMGSFAGTQQCPELQCMHPLLPLQ